MEELGSNQRFRNSTVGTLPADLANCPLRLIHETPATRCILT
jgi:hypothetical protein